ncbi:hypothetical protein [Estrella lausannensis]|nr:hypothetical protein [Estrella lausannensis]
MIIILAQVFFLFSSAFGFAAADNNLAADLSFLVADLKYSEKEGVKICEIQPGSLSVFSGYDFLLNDTGLVARGFCEVLERFQHKVWFINKGICDPKMKKEYLLRGYKEKRSMKDLLASLDFRETAHHPLYDPSSLTSYAGAVYSSVWASADFATIRDKYPSMLIIDRAFIPFFSNKEGMSSLFLQDPDLMDLKPRWKSYLKQYRPGLADEIIEDMASDMVVIKPIRSSKGYGVLIVAREELDSVLKQLFFKTGSLSLHKDEEYQYWARDQSKRFIVEAFHASDPVSAPLLGGGRYDPTMRVVFFLIFNEGKMEVVFVEGHWKLPKISLDGQGSLTLKHKSYGEIPHFQLVEDSVLAQVESILRERLILFYKKALNLGPKGVAQ